MVLLKAVAGGAGISRNVDVRRTSLYEWIAMLKECI